ncbi:glutamine amidotransferase [Trinickia terrae]|uniref:Glutamine amidotransferase n=1 Tax=Trinickia terrae TaxID=2571161 RepID=A0A4V5PL88_9BURK|nr:glutamine amidotransferase [Trinickia terrae]TKC83530.1 glutamine amidotransferase [Trinickia terrae]
MTNREVLAIRHVSFEDAGSLERVFGERGLTIRYLDVGLARLDAPDPAAAVLTLVLGGPISAYDDAAYPTLKPLLSLLEKRIAAGFPTLGICLGAQLIARVLGSRVYPAAKKELGWSPLTLTAAGQASPLRHLDGAHTSMLHWHGDTFDLPAGAVHLARTPDCENQAFSWGSHVLGFQCHPEIRAERFEPWLIGHAGEIGAMPGVDAQRLRADTARLGPALEAAARETFDEWFDAAGVARR